MFYPFQLPNFQTHFESKNLAVAQSWHPWLGSTGISWAIHDPALEATSSPTSLGWPQLRILGALPVLSAGALSARHCRWPCCSAPSLQAPFHPERIWTVDRTWNMWEQNGTRRHTHTHTYIYIIHIHIYTYYIYIYTRIYWDIVWYYLMILILTLAQTKHSVLRSFHVGQQGPR